MVDAHVNPVLLDMNETKMLYFYPGMSIRNCENTSVFFRVSVVSGKNIEIKTLLVISLYIYVMYILETRVIEVK